MRALRTLSLAALTALLAGVAARAGAEDLYTFVDRDGVLHVTNAPSDRRFHRARGSYGDGGGVHRIVIRGRSVRTGGGAARTVALGAPSTSFEAHIQAAADKYGLPMPLLKAVMAVESNFDPGAVSEKGATGLMQLMPGTARDLEVGDAYDPAQNIEGGARYLRQLQDRFGNDLQKVLAAYNAGPEAVRRSGGTIPEIPETQAYVRKVLALYEQYLKGS